MKLTKIFAIVFSLHLCAICFLFVLPGCATKDKKADTDKKSTLGTDDDEMAAPPAGRDVHPDFNAGLTGSGEPTASQPAGRYPPTRPSWDFQSDTTEDTPREILQPAPKLPQPTDTTRPEENKGIQMYTVRSGDTLSKIARKYGTTVAKLKNANALESDLIRIGDPLIIPGGSGPPQKAPTAAKAPAKKKSAATGEAVHIVVSGDTPSGIARQYGMSSRELMDLNHISDPTKLQIGQRLMVKAGKAPATTPRSASAVRYEAEESSVTPPTVDKIDERERSILEEEEDIPVIPLDADEGGGQGSAN